MYYYTHVFSAKQIIFRSESAALAGYSIVCINNKYVSAPSLVLNTE